MGVVLWWLIGRTRIERKRRARRRSAAEFAGRHGQPHSEADTGLETRLPVRAVGASIFPSLGNRVELLFDAEAMPAMQAAIESATSSIHALFYIWRDDETGVRMRDALACKASQGVRVRVLVDSFGSSRFMKRLAPKLTAAGAQAACYFPSRLDPLRAPRVNFVNHRKMLVVDDRQAFTGGMNIGDEYAGPWHDLMARIEGPAVKALQHLFLDDWYFASGEDVDPGVPHAAVRPGDVACAVVASGPDTETWIHDSFFRAINDARERVWLLTPYFIPSSPLLTALRVAASIGVDVRVLLPANSDIPLVKVASRAYYPELLRAGVRVFEHQGDVIHAKAMIVDELVSSIGSANFDSRSFRLSFEVGCFFRHAGTNARLADYYESLRAGSEELTLKDLDGRPLGRKLVEAAAHLLSPLL